VGPETRGVEKMLRRIGFEYAERIDPFDGGPHFIARTDEITLVRDMRRAHVSAVGAVPDATWASGLVSIGRAAQPRFAAVPARFRLEGGEVALSEETRRELGVAAGEEVGVLSF